MSRHGVVDEYSLVAKSAGSQERIGVFADTAETSKPLSETPQVGKALAAKGHGRPDAMIDDDVISRLGGEMAQDLATVRNLPMRSAPCGLLTRLVVQRTSAPEPHGGIPLICGSEVFEVVRYTQRRRRRGRRRCRRLRGRVPCCAVGHIAATAGVADIVDAPYRAATDSLSAPSDVPHNHDLVGWAGLPIQVVEAGPKLDGLRR